MISTNPTDASFAVGNTNDDDDDRDRGGAHGRAAVV
jgi:hypothetical protein